MLSRSGRPNRIPPADRLPFSFQYGDFLVDGSYPTSLPVFDGVAPRHIEFQQSFLDFGKPFALFNDSIGNSSLYLPILTFDLG